MPWPQLFDPSQQSPDPDKQWSPVARQFGINAIPTVFLIDRKGVLRTAEGPQEAAELVGKLIDEK